MDRFIVTESQMLETTLPNLKSNMDRFIDQGPKAKQEVHLNLKSNMDRFIVTTLNDIESVTQI